MSAHLSHHILRAPQPAKVVRFLKERLGLEVTTLVDGAPPRWLATQRNRATTPLAPSPHDDAAIELWQTEDDGRAYAPQDDDAYWKLALTLRDVDRAAAKLRTAGVTVGAPRQVLDVAYLCHFRDPADHIIELVQHDFAENFEEAGVDAATSDSGSLPLGQPFRVGLSTLRVPDPAPCIAFYEKHFGMRLLSRQRVDPFGFTLYFLACTEEEPPDPDIDAVVNREWLWRRPYTCIELQHVWRDGAPSAYRHTPDDASTGFWGLGFVADNLASRHAALTSDGYQATKIHTDETFRTDAFVVVDPAGFRLRVLGRQV